MANPLNEIVNHINDAMQKENQAVLKKFGYTKDNRPLVLLGLSGENLTRLMAGEPIAVKLPEAALGMPGGATATTTTPSDDRTPETSQPRLRLIQGNAA